MSNFTGVTFAQQKVLPSDDAIIRRSLLSDGILYGCEISYSGSTLTMAAGQLLACGRQFRHPSSQNWAVVDATSGFARLVLTVDLTRTSTKEVFEQIVDSIEYASSVDGFPELDQTDINTSGTRYQVAACVISLGTGGITGIVSQLGPCEGTGGGGLNFSVVGGLTLPANPKENTIWVETDVPITSYTFSATEPSPATAGMVWITTGAYSTVEFNALKKNGLQVYPISAKQYVGGAWVDKTAKSYQSGEWVDWIRYLYNNGDQCSDVTGGWSTHGLATLAPNCITFNPTSSKRYSNAYTKNKVSLKDVSKLIFKLKGSLVAQGGGSNVTIWINPTTMLVSTLTGPSGYAAGITMDKTTTFGETTIDVSSLNDSYYIGCHVGLGSDALSTIELSEVYYV